MKERKNERKNERKKERKKERRQQDEKSKVNKDRSEIIIKFLNKEIAKNVQ